MCFERRNHRVLDNCAQRQISQCKTACTQTNVNVWINLRL
uniref:Uncharacterized protein n=1 Tax=Anguilla anguilla TaxID=7936 RepID=A0A0E9QCX7_ANGAN